MSQDLFFYVSTNDLKSGSLLKKTAGRYRKDREKKKLKLEKTTINTFNGY